MLTETEHIVLTETGTKQSTILFIYIQIIHLMDSLYMFVVGTVTLSTGEVPSRTDCSLLPTPDLNARLGRSRRGVRGTGSVSWSPRTTSSSAVVCGSDGAVPSGRRRLQDAGATYARTRP